MESEQIVEKIMEERFNNILNHNFKKELEDNIRSLARKIIDEMNHNTTQNNHNFITKKENGKTDHSSNKLGADKLFMPRNSLLTDLLKISHIKTIYNIFVVILILLFLNTVIYDLINIGRINLGLRLIKIGFGNISIVVIIWMCMQFAAFLAFPLLRKWALTRQILLSKPERLRIWDICWLSFFITSLFIYFWLPIRESVNNNLPIASALIVNIESVRMIMKIYAFVRSVSPRALNITETSNIPLPEFSNYLYFLFAPTLIYRDSYPRTDRIRWNKVVNQLIEVATIIFYINFLSERFLVHNFSTFGKSFEVLESRQLVLTFFGSTLPALLTFLCCFYLLLHCWHNAAAEMLTFADRMFYLDWWNQTGYGGYYRTWNLIVHDWLYTYIYKDIYRLSQNKMMATLSVFIVSAIFHEIIITFSLRFFYPVLLVLFGVFGVLLVFITKHINPTIGNIMMWFTLAVGNGVLWLAYGLEYFARANCPQIIENDIYDILVPRSWFCYYNI